MLYKDKKGNKLYPVCSWEKNQHKLYNAHDRLFVAICDAREEGNVGELSRLLDTMETLERVMGIFDSYVVEGIVYATYKDGLIIKDYIWAYDARH